MGPIVQNVVAAANATAKAPVNWIGEFPHKMVAWVSAGGVWLGIAMATAANLISDQSVQAALPAVVNFLPASGVVHTVGLGLIATAPLIAAIRAYRPRLVTPTNPQTPTPLDEQK